MCRDQNKQHKLCTGDCISNCKRTGASAGKWTAGPWTVPHMARDDIECSCGYILADGMFGAVATVHIDNGLNVGSGGNDCPPEDEAKANAHLIAAAPELYEALEAIHRLHCDDVFIKDAWHSAFETASNTLAKARGEGDD